MGKMIFSWGKRILILLVGVPIVALGIVLIPLPGPGLLVIIAGLAILSLEFEFARKWFELAKEKLFAATKDARSKLDEERKKLN